jgi:hypothetical protein
MVSGLLVVLTVAVLQLALALHVRTTLIDAASEGARYAALADSGLDGGVQRTRDLIAVAVGSSYAEDVSAEVVDRGGAPVVEMHVDAPLPVIGLLGVDVGMEVTAHAPLEKIATE